MKTSNSPRKEAIKEHLSKFSVGFKDLFQNVCKMYCQGKPQIWNLIEILAEGQTNIFFLQRAISAVIKEKILQQVKSYFLQPA